MARVLVSIWLYCLATLSPVALADGVQAITYYQNDARNKYEVELLQHVLNLTAPEYGRAVLQFKQKPADMRDELALIRYVDVTFFASSLAREHRALAVKIPLLQGMLGYRLLLTTPESNQNISRTQNLEDFRTRFIGGVGLYWEDLRILNHNGLAMKTSVDFESLFSMLSSHEIDYFALGVNEIFNLAEEYSKSHPRLQINSDIAFFYPFPTYYFVRKGNAELAKRLETGLLRAEADGSFKRLFVKHNKGNIDELNALKLKKVFFLENRNVTIGQPMKFHWWLEESPLNRLH